MGQTERLMDLWLYIVKHREFTAGELAQKFSVSHRTIVRDLDQLSVIGVPLYTVQGKGGGYRVLDSINLPPISFSEDELNSILFAYYMLDLMGDNPFHVEVETVREKLVRQMPDYIRDRAAELTEHLDFMYPRREVVPNALREVYLASLSRTEVCFSYGGRESAEEIECFPIGAYAWEGFWYAVGYVPDARRYRIFRVDRIIHMERIPESIAPDGLWTLAEWKGRGFEEQQAVQIVLELSPRALRGIVNPWMHRGKSRALPDGKQLLTFECPESQVKFVIPEILRLGAQAKVIRPTEIAEQIMHELEKSLENYRI